LEVRRAEAALAARIVGFALIPVHRRAIVYLDDASAAIGTRPAKRAIPESGSERTSSLSNSTSVILIESCTGALPSNRTRVDRIRRVLRVL
jgi:hypothetical protein